MMKRLLSALVLGSAVALAPMVHADKAPSKIGVLDVRQIIADSAETKSIEQALKKEYQPKIDEIQNLDKALRSNMEKLQRDQEVLSAAEKTKLEKKIKESQQELITKQNQYAQESAGKQQKMMQEFLDKVKKEVESFAQKEGYELILISDAVPYMSGKNDITSHIIKALKEKGSKS
ncbi:MAG TPA: OmpH family outer membrane protein [Gammaproteobacteria bacterium]|nr:OmpH family outer membrane protein [Gammaproteobacteria bacterium]